MNKDKTKRIRKNIVKIKTINKNKNNKNGTKYIKSRVKK